MKFTIEQVRYATIRAHERKDAVVHKALGVLEDPHKEQRLKECQCPACFYLDRYRLAGQAFTEWVCQACEEEQPSWPNTTYPKLCIACGQKLRLCVECLADLDLRARNKIELRGSSRRRR